MVEIFSVTFRQDDNIQILQGQLILLDSLVGSLDGEYKKFLTAHPD
jgi:hypothetical protein